jgi:predicted TIM-barrel fold metal-dependent hydrolase
MLTRRSVIEGAFGLCVYEAAERCSIAAPTLTPPASAIPRGACDSHVHVIGDLKRFPMDPHRDYTPAPATADDLQKVLEFLRLDRVVIVTPVAYGSDNSATVAAIEQLGRERARGIAWVNSAMRPETLNRIKEAGVIGVRLFLSTGNSIDRPAAARRLQKAIDLAEPWGWHLQISTSPEVIDALQDQLAAAPVPIVLDYFGWVAGGVGQRGFDAIVSLLAAGHIYVKLSEPYRLSKKPPDYIDLVSVVHAYVAANRDRLLWGSGWPHVSGGIPGRPKSEISPNLAVDTGHQLNLLADWIPNPETRRKILVDNPAALYGFEQTPA